MLVKLIKLSVQYFGKLHIYPSPPLLLPHWWIHILYVDDWLFKFL